MNNLPRLSLFVFGLIINMSAVQSSFLSYYCTVAHTLLMRQTQSEQRCESIIQPFYESSLQFCLIVKNVRVLSIECSANSKRQFLYFLLPKKTFVMHIIIFDWMDFNDSPIHIIKNIAWIKINESPSWICAHHRQRIPTEKVKPVEISYDWIWDFTLYNFWIFLSSFDDSICVFSILLLYFVQIYDWIIDRIEWWGIRN